MNWWNMWEHSTPEALEFTQVKRNNHHPIPWIDKGKFYMFLAQLPLHVTTEPAMPRGLRQLAGSVGSFWGFWGDTSFWENGSVTESVTDLPQMDQTIFYNLELSMVFINFTTSDTESQFVAMCQLFPWELLGSPILLKIDGYVGAFGNGGWFQVDDYHSQCFDTSEKKHAISSTGCSLTCMIVMRYKLFLSRFGWYCCCTKSGLYSIPPIRAHPRKVWAST